jgi:hypothetical protein
MYELTLTCSLAHCLRSDLQQCDKLPKLGITGYEEGGGVSCGRFLGVLTNRRYGGLVGQDIGTVPSPMFYKI